MASILQLAGMFIADFAIHLVMMVIGVTAVLVILVAFFCLWSRL